MTHKVSRKNAGEHKCHQCMGEYVDGFNDCEIVDCPLYTYMPYRKLEPNLDWLNWTPKGRGRRPYKTMSEEHKEKIKRNFNSGEGR